MNAVFNKLSYELVATGSELILNRAIKNNGDITIIDWRQHLEYLQSCGWSNFEFDLETLKRIDTSWDINYSKN